MVEEFSTYFVGKFFVLTHDVTAHEYCEEAIPGRKRLVTSKCLHDNLMNKSVELAKRLSLDPLDVRIIFRHHGTLF